MSVSSGGPERAPGVRWYDPGAWASVAALGFVFVVTVLWWSLALWPVPVGAPDWLLRTRAVCFNITDTGLPDVSGWMILAGQPLLLIALQAVGWPGSLQRGLRALRSTARGRGVALLAALVLVTGLTAASVRVVGALEAAAPPTMADAPAGPPVELDRNAPRDALIDQHGDRFGIDSFAGRPVLVAFGFGHCATICPVVVAQANEVRRRLSGEMDVALLVVTLDPWRDTPARLPHLADQFSLTADARIVSGTVDDVEAALDAWQVPRQRDLGTGDIVHPPLVYVVDGEGRVRYAAAGGVDALVRLVRAVGP